MWGPWGFLRHTLQPGRNLGYPRGSSVYVEATGQPKLTGTVTSNTPPFRPQAWGQGLSSAPWWAPEWQAHGLVTHSPPCTDPH